ncbi:MAG: transketolase [Firmicutes bacterium]|nr:transketolase [Bacillota bacterium]
MDTPQIAAFAAKIRLEAVRMIYEGGDGHPGPALSIADIVAVLYGQVLRVNPAQPDWPDRDRMILSKGHACPILYAALNETGYFGDRIEHFHLRELGSMFQGHPVMQKTPGVDMTSGSLGNGLPIACGMAIAAKIQKKDYRVYVIAGDGEMQEGVGWEAVMTAAHHKLDNLTLFVDNNGWQSGGTLNEVAGIDEFEMKFRAFGWHVISVDGHDHAALLRAVETAKATSVRPTVILCRCVKGKCLSFMENDNAWHKKVPTDAEMALAAEELGGVR